MIERENSVDKPLIKTYKQFQAWIQANQDKVLLYVLAHDQLLNDDSLSPRVYNALRMYKKYRMSDIVFWDMKEISALIGLTGKQALEQIQKIYFSHHKEDIIAFVCADDPSDETETVSASIHKVKSLMLDPRKKNEIILFFTTVQIPLENLNLSVRSFNCLKRYRINFFHEVLPLYPEQFLEIPNLGRLSSVEICEKIEQVVLDLYVYRDEVPGKLSADPETLYIDPRHLTGWQLVSHPDFRERAIEYIKAHNVNLKDLKIHNVSDNLTLYDAICTTEPLSKLVCGKIEAYLSCIFDQLLHYCTDIHAMLYDDPDVKAKILGGFANAPFVGRTYFELREAFPTQVPDEQLERCVEQLENDEKIKRIDTLLYRVYPSFFVTLGESAISEEERDIIIKRCNGVTLETIGEEYGITRERIRQKYKKIMKQLRRISSLQNGTNVFCEDYYVYLYTNYLLDKEFVVDYLSLPNEIMGYLANEYRMGSKSLDEALEDSSIDFQTKLKIQEYLNRNKILLDGILVERKRTIVEKFVLSRIAANEIKFEDFTVKYNAFLERNGIDFDEDLYYTENVIRSRKNRFANSMHCLWKFGERLRYYPIEARDYTDILDALQLESFSNIQLSTLKFTEAFPEVMEEYDIRDHYELHNLLKKIADTYIEQEIHFGRQPTISFGEFDITNALMELLSELSPVSEEDFVNRIHEEYGYDHGTIRATYLQPLKLYYHQGIYTLDYPMIPDERSQILLAQLSEDFYYVSEIKKIYGDLFGAAYLDEINPYTLKQMGFIVNSNYVVRNCSSAMAYFERLLTERDVYDSTDMDRRYGHIGVYNEIKEHLRRTYQIFAFGRRQFVSIDKLNAVGITKEDVCDYCMAVKKTVKPQEFFTIHSLRMSGFVSKLDELGFDDAFYVGILTATLEFARVCFNGVYVLRLKCLDERCALNQREVIRYFSSMYDCVGIDAFVKECQLKYGVDIKEKHDIVEALSDTDMYYDRIMEKIYKNKELYYADIKD